MQTRDELYEVLGYRAYEDRLDELFAAGKEGDPGTGRGES
jgi:hypothetical protein